MAAEPRPRPTRADWQSVIPQVSDDWYNAYANQMPQEPSQEEAGFFGRAVESAKAVGEGLTFLPGGMVDTVQDAVFGFDPSGKEEMAQRVQRENELQAHQQKYAGQAWEGVTDAMAEITAKREAAVQAVKDPKTLDDYRNYIYHHMDQGKTPHEARMQRIGHLAAGQTHLDASALLLDGRGIDSPPHLPLLVFYEDSTRFYRTTGLSQHSDKTVKSR